MLVQDRCHLRIGALHTSVISDYHLPSPYLSRLKLTTSTALSLSETSILPPPPTSIASCTHSYIPDPVKSFRKQAYE